MMQGEDHKELKDALLSLGFSPTNNSGEYSRNPDKIGSMANSEAATEEKHKVSGSELESPFRIQSWMLSISADGHLSSDLSITLALDKVKARLEYYATKVFGPSVNSQFLGNESGEVWCLFEFQRPEPPIKSRNKENSDSDASIPVGLGGFRFQLVTANKYVRIVVSDHFGLGYIPQTFIAALPNYLTDVLGITHSVQLVPCKEDPSIYEFPFRVECIALPNLGKGIKYWNDEKIKLLAKSIENSSPSGSISTDFRSNTWTLSTNGKISPAVFRRHRVALEVLESRESGGKFRKVDEFFLKEQFTNAEKVCEQFLEHNPRSIFLIRRMAFLGISGFAQNGGDEIKNVLAKEPKNKLFISHEIARAIKNQNFSESLEHLSTLGQCLMEDGLSVEDNHVFDLVFPEMLGDSWLSENVEMAISCYERVLQKRGDIPRIIRKLIAIMRQCEKHDIELALLDRLSRVEVKQDESSSIFFRRAELAAEDNKNPQVAIELALQSLQFDRSQFRAAILAADLLNKCQRTEEAIELLADLVRDQELNITGKSRATMECKIAGMWLDALSRPDLAISRFESALQFDSTNFVALLALEKIYFEEGRYLELVEIQLNQFDGMKEGGSDNELWRLFGSIHDLYSEKLRLAERIAPVFQKFLEKIDPLSERSPQILLYDFSVDWQPFVQKLKESVENHVPSPERARGLGLLAQILLKKFNAKAEAIGYLLISMDSGWLSPEHFRILVVELQESGNLQQLVICLKWQLARAPLADHRPLIEQILLYEKYLLPAEIDLYVLEAYSPDPGDQERFQARVNFYVVREDFDSAQKLLDRLLDLKVGISCEIKWLTLWNKILKESRLQTRFERLDRNFRRLLSLNETDLSIYTEAIDALKEPGNEIALAFYVSAILSRGILPVLTHETVLAIFADAPLELAGYYEQRAISAVDKIQAASWARSAASLLEQVPHSQPRRERMLNRMATSMHCTDSTLETLKSLVTISGNWPLYADAVLEQISFTKKRSELEALKAELAFVYRYKTKEPELARAVFESMIKTTEDVSYILLQLAEIGGEIQDDQLAVKSLKEILEQQDPFSNPGQYCTAITRLHSILRETSYLHKIVSPHIENASNQGNYKVAAEMAHCLLGIGVSEPRLWLVKFKDLVKSEKIHLIADCWLSGLRLIEKGEGLQEYVSDTRKFLAMREQTQHYRAILQYAHDSEILKEMHWDAKNELTYSFACVLFDDKISQERSLSVFQTYHQQRPDDRRVWLPIYFLLREFGSPSDRRLHLERILPPIKEDSAVLHRYPITIESLEKELRSLRWNFGPSAAEPVSSAMGQNQSPRLEEVATLISEEQFIRDGEIENSRITSIFTRGSPIDKFENFGLPDFPRSAETNVEDPIDFLSTDPAAPMKVADEVVKAERNDSFSKREARIRELLSIENEESDPENLEIDIDDVSASEDIQRFNEAQVEITRTDLALVVPITESLAIREGRKLREESSLPLPSTDDFLGLGQDFSAPQVETAMEAESDKIKDEDSGRILSLWSDSSPGLIPMAAFPNDSVGFAPDQLAMPSSEELPDFEIQAQLEPITGEKPPDVAIDFDPSVPYFDPEIAMVYDKEALLNVPSAEPQGNNGGNSPSFQTKQALVMESLSGSGFVPQFNLDLSGDSRAGPIAKAINEKGRIAVSMQPVRPAPRPGSPDFINWREIAASTSVPDRIVDKILLQEYPSEIEKHLAIQVLAVRTGDLRALRDWKWQSWRNLNQCLYPIAIEDRFPPGELATSLNSPLFRLVITLVPVMIRVFKQKYTTAGLAGRLKVPQAELASRVRELRWNEGELKRSGLHLFEDNFKSQQQRVFGLEGLGSFIFYDGVMRFFYIDDKFYNANPPSHLFHRFLGVTWALKKHFFAPLQLDARREAMGLMSAIEKIIFTTSSGKFKKILGGPVPPLEKILESSNFEAIKAAYRAVGPVSENALEKLWKDMIFATLQFQLAETLDFIGLCESVSNRDFLAQPLYHDEAQIASPYVAALINFAIKLNVAASQKWVNGRNSA
jgi:tetratricopeptide (TPR) repeat protein